MASSTAGLLFGKIVSILENEALLLSRVRDEINEIKRELNTMKSFLDDANKKGLHSKTENDWVTSVRDITDEVEDVIDKYIYDMKKQQQWRGKYTKFLLKGIHYPHSLWLQHKVAQKLQEINKRIKSIPERSKRYGVYQLEGRDNNIEGMSSYYDLNWVKNQSDASLFLKDDDLVGIKKSQRELLGWLMNGELQRTVISVVGMGGLGKTTLVANTFNKQIVKQYFDYYVWITVSQQYAINELLGSMVREIYKKKNEEINPVNLNTMSYRELVETLVEYLQSRRYLIVLDDVWSIKFWKEISSALPNSGNGSRVLLTTRMDEVASFEFGVVNHILPLKPLKDAEPWTLFCMRAFPSNFGRCPPYLDSLAANLVEKCGGLPLALVTLGGLMSSKKSIAEWQFILNNLNWELSNNPELEAMKCISLLAYHHLPYRLKHCFLYCCMFPENHMIKRKRLIRLWMAEGFLEPITGATPEVVAERYLIELICRGLLQVAKRNGSGRPKEMKMHDLLREFALSISETERFLAISDGKAPIEANGIRRLSIEAKDERMEAGKGILSHLRSLFLFPVDGISVFSFNRLPSGFKLLRVLDLEDAPISELPGDLVNLFNLRYLNLTRTRVKELPKSIGKLHNLQSLIVRETKIKELPPGIVKLKNLRYLIAYRYSLRNTSYESILSTRMPSKIFLIKSLRILSFVKAGGSFIKELNIMTQLTRLEISNFKGDDEKDLCFAIGKMRFLRYLMVMARNEEECLNMDALESPPPCLEKLILAGKLEKVPRWFNSLRSLTWLYLHWSRLREDLLPHIQALPNLGKIHLLNA